MSKKPPDPPPKIEDVPDTELQERFGANFRLFRQHAGLTQVQVSEMSGIGQSDISKIERGAFNLTLTTMQKLAKIVDHDVSNLLSQSPKLPTTK